jgi:hypothetical protein
VSIFFSSLFLTDRAAEVTARIDFQAFEGRPEHELKRILRACGGSIPAHYPPVIPMLAALDIEFLPTITPLLNPQRKAVLGQREIIFGFEVCRKLEIP